MPKRKRVEAVTLAEQDTTSRRRSSRLKTETTGKSNSSGEETGRNANRAEEAKAGRTGRRPKGSPKPQAAAARGQEQAPPTKPSKSEPKSAAAENTDAATGENPAAKRYWLMKAEPESRFENGVDVKFSIDDLAARTEPEPWDGIRSYQARNKLREMQKDDLAFFYHSNCKEPGIAGIMRIVHEASPDPSQFNPKAPYYDPSSGQDKPKWDLVHVEFVSKFPVPLSLKELRRLGAPGEPLERMQMLRMARLSVSEVTADEWEFLLGVLGKKAEGAGS